MAAPPHAPPPSQVGESYVAILWDTILNAAEPAPQRIVEYVARLTPADPEVAGPREVYFRTMASAIQISRPAACPSPSPVTP